jgi:hypothetical protein
MQVIPFLRPYHSLPSNIESRVRKLSEWKERGASSRSDNEGRETGSVQRGVIQCGEEKLSGEDGWGWCAWKGRKG